MQTSHGVLGFWGNITEGSGVFDPDIGFIWAGFLAPNGARKLHSLAACFCFFNCPGYYATACG